MNTSVTSYGYKIKKTYLNSIQIQKIKKDLLIIPFVYDPVKNQQNKDKKFNILCESPKAFYIPRFYGIDNFGLPDCNKLPGGDDININFNGDLREIQKPIADSYIKVAKERGGGLISLKCGGGKTVLALNIACQLKKKTIVVVHKSFLMTQWAERIRQFIPDASIGYIQGKTIDVEDKDIVLAMLQSLSQKEYDENLFKPYGFSIWDECHHLSAEVFSKAMRKISPKYILGLSATIKRQDNTHHVFKMYLGDTVYESPPEEINEHITETRIINFDCDDNEYCKIQTIYNGTICRPKMVNQICEYKPRTNMVLDYLYKYYDEGRTVLILSERRNHLIDMMNEINGYYKSEVSGLYIGGIHPEVLEQTSKLRCILGSYQMFSEGADIPSLDTVILASPVSSVEQSIGRIFRKYGKFHKLICDIVDLNIPCFEKQSKKRSALYKKKKFHLYENDNTEKTDYKSRKTKKEKPVYQQACLF